MTARLTLVLETSAPAASLLLAGDEGVIAEGAFCSDRSHNAVLFGPLEEVLRKAGPGGIARVLVGSGPGSYSGTRVGLAAAQGVALAAGCPVIAVPSVVATPSAEGGRPCLVIGDARRGGFWLSEVAGGNVLRAPELTDAEGLLAAVNDARGRGLAVATFEPEARKVFSEGVDPAHEVPQARLLWAAWQAADEVSRTAWAAEAPQPVYLRPPHITEAKRPWLAAPK